MLFCCTRALSSVGSRTSSSVIPASFFITFLLSALGWPHPRALIIIIIIIPSSKEPHGLVRSDGKRPDGLTLVPWKGGKPLAWDVTAVCTVADSYVAATAREAGAAVERAAELKISKYSGLEDKCVFQREWSRTVHSMRELVSF